MMCFCPTTSKHEHKICQSSNSRRSISISATTNSDEETSFYKRLNSPKHILAPMVAQSDLPFRLMCEQLYNVDLSYTQMIHAYNFVEPNGDIFRTNHLDVYDHSTVRNVLLGIEDSSVLMKAPSQSNAIKGLSESDIEQSRMRILAAIAKQTGNSNGDIPPIKRTIVQIAGHNPNIAVRAANMILERAGADAVAGVDLNLGCPQSIARKGKYGSFLHDEDPEVTYSVLSALRSNLPHEIGVTAKIRLPPTQDDANSGKLNMSQSGRPQTIDERMKRLIDCGVDLITVHGRTRFENKVAVKAANWDAIQQATSVAREYSGNSNYPIFANGGIEFGQDIQRCLDSTQASGVMSSESLLEMPGLFCHQEERESDTSAKGLFERQLGYAGTYLDYSTILPPVPGSLGTKGGSFNVIRSHLFKILHRYLEENPNLRSWLGNQELNTIKQARELILDLRLIYENLDEEQRRQKSSFDNSWYRRHRRQDAQQQETTPAELTIEERKALARMRILKLKEKRKSKLKL